MCRHTPHFVCIKLHPQMTQYIRGGFWCSASDNRVAGPLIWTNEWITTDAVVYFFRYFAFISLLVHHYHSNEILDNHYLLTNYTGGACCIQIRLTYLVPHCCIRHRLKKYAWSSTKNICQWRSDTRSRLQGSTLLLAVTKASASPNQ